MAVHTTLNKLREDSDLTEQIKVFVQTTSIPLRLIDSKGRIIWKSDFFKSRLNFCDLLQSNRFHPSSCRKAHQEAARESMRWGEAIISKCCYFIMQIVAPILEKGRLAGNLVASPFLLINPSELQPEELLISGLLKVREAQELQGKIAEQIYDLKNIERDFTPSSLSRLFYEREREIVTKIRLGDRSGAKEILFQLLAILLTQYLENFELLKISILELLIILSRAAVQAGAKREEMLGMRYGFVTELARIKDQETLCLWVVKVLEKLTDGIYETRHSKNFQRLRKALDFIQSNYNNALTVEQIAKEIYLSPSRLSHIIKDELGITLVDYISKVRIDKSKAFLKERELSLSQIALEVGYPDQSYFTKVFKKIEKCTPKAFRQNVSELTIPHD